MVLIEGLTVIGVFAHAHLRTIACSDFQKPVGVGKALAREADDIGRTVCEHRLCRLKVEYSASGYNGCVKTSRPDC